MNLPQTICFGPFKLICSLWFLGPAWSLLMTLQAIQLLGLQVWSGWEQKALTCIVGV